jgi:hypothetical protein
MTFTGNDVVQLARSCDARRIQQHTLCVSAHDSSISGREPVASHACGVFLVGGLSTVLEAGVITPLCLVGFRHGARRHLVTRGHATVQQKAATAGSNTPRPPRGHEVAVS